MKIKINTAFQNFKKDEVLDIKTNANNTPLDKFWRRRLSDSIRDNCVSIVEEVKEVTTEVSPVVEVLVEKVAESPSKKAKSV